MPATTTTHPYEQAARVYVARGWVNPLPARPGTKRLYVSGFHGGEYRTPTAHEIGGWIRRHRAAQIALRLPPEIVGIDVDPPKPADGGGMTPDGADHLNALELEHGPLPGTVVSSSKPAPYGIRLYRVPAGTDTAGWGDPGDGIELIRAGHRYIIAPPSIHPGTGCRYEWRNLPEDGRLPAPSDLPELPAGWVTYLTGTAPAEPLARQFDNWAERDRINAALPALVDLLPAAEYVGTRTDKNGNTVADYRRPGATGNRSYSISNLSTPRERVRFWTANVIGGVETDGIRSYGRAEIAELVGYEPEPAEPPDLSPYHLPGNSVVLNGTGPRRLYVNGREWGRSVKDPHHHSYLIENEIARREPEPDREVTTADLLAEIRRQGNESRTYELDGHPITLTRKTLLYGSPGCGKSTLAREFAAAELVRGGRVRAVDVEDPKIWVEILDPLGKKDIRWGDYPDPETTLLIVDDLARFLTRRGYSEDRSADTVTALAEIGERWPAAICLLIHHPGKPNERGYTTPRGSSRWVGEPRTVIRVTDRQTIRIEKSNYGPIPPALQFTLADGWLTVTGEVTPLPVRKAQLGEALAAIVDGHGPALRGATVKKIGDYLDQKKLSAPNPNSTAGKPYATATTARKIYDLLKEPEQDELDLTDPTDPA